MPLRGIAGRVKLVLCSFCTRASLGSDLAGRFRVRCSWQAAAQLFDDAHQLLKARTRARIRIRPAAVKSTMAVPVAAIGPEALVVEQARPYLVGFLGGRGEVVAVLPKGVALPLEGLPLFPGLALCLFPGFADCLFLGLPVPACPDVVARITAETAVDGALLGRGLRGCWTTGIPFASLPVCRSSWMGTSRRPCSSQLV